MFLVLTVPITIAISLTLALVTRRSSRLSWLYETAFSLPIAVSSSAIALIFQLLFMPTLGLINQCLRLEIRWLYDEKYVLYSLAIIQVWLSSGYTYLFFLSALRNIPKNIIESAYMDGVTRFQLDTKICLPLIAPTIVYLVFIECAVSLMMMSLSNILTGGGPQYASITLVQYIYGKFISTGNASLSNAAAAVTVLLYLMFTAGFIFLRNRLERDL